MPKISEFYGISIYMYHKDHNPPHFHAIYGEFDIIVDIKENKILDGRMPNKAVQLILEWSLINQDKLLENWDLVSRNKDIFKISPLI